MSISLGGITQERLWEAIHIAKNKIGELPPELAKEAEEDMKFDMSILNETREVMQELILQPESDITFVTILLLTKIFLLLFT